MTIHCRQHVFRSILVTMAFRKRKAAPSATSSSSKKTPCTQTSEDAPKKETFTHWLVKSEPESRMEKGVDVKFGLEDLKAEPDQTACWDGVRNYQARNNMMAMKRGQTAFFYHSNCKPPGIVA